MMEKQGVITDDTPPEGEREKRGTTQEPDTPQQADQLDDHASKRLSDAVTEASRR